MSLLEGVPGVATGCRSVGESRRGAHVNAPTLTHIFVRPPPLRPVPTLPRPDPSRLASSRFQLPLWEHFRAELQGRDPNAALSPS